MIRRMCVFVVIFFVGSSYSQASFISDEISDSGLAYILVKMPDNPRVSVKVAWPSHWAFEEEQNQAVPYIGAQLIFAGGAKGYSASEAVERFKDMNSEGQLVPTTDYLFGTLHFSPKHQDETLKIANAHLRSSALDEQWLQRIRGQFTTQINEMRAKADRKGFEAMRWAVLGKQPLRVAVSLDEANNIEEVSQEEVATWAKSTLNRSGVSVVVAGDLNTDTANTIVDALFEGILEGENVKETSIETDFSPKRILMHVPDAQTSTLSFIGKLPPTREGSEFEDILLATSLGGGAQSVLFEAVRTKLRASYGYGAGIDGFTRDDRFLVLSGQVEAGKVEGAEKVIRQAYTEFRANGPSGDLQQLKQPFSDNLKVAQEDSGTMAYSVLLAMLDGRDVVNDFSLQTELEAVSEESLIKRLSASFPVADDFIVVVSSPDATALKNACVITEQKQAMNCKVRRPQD